MAVIAAQFRRGGLLVVEGEFATWTARNVYGEIASDVFRDINRRDARILGGNLYFRAGTRRVAGVAGGGIGVHFIRNAIDGQSQSNTHLGAQLLGGADFTLSQRFVAFAMLRAQILPAGNVGATAGVRVVLSDGQTPRTEPPSVSAVSQPAAQDIRGKEVRVTETNGTRRAGRFVSLSDTDVVFTQEGQPVTLPLAGVRQIETVSHHARTGLLLGLAAGVGVAFAGCATDDNFCGDDAGFGGFAAIFGGIGAGAGLAIGAMINASSAERHLIYQRKMSGTTIAVVPVVAAGKAGGVLRLRW